MADSDKRVTIYDIAHEMNVSATTVYRALNGKGRINIETRNRILETAENMGYKANLAASSMSRKAIRIGVVIDLYFPGFHDEIISGMKDTFGQLYDFKVDGIFTPLDEAYDRKTQMEKLKSLVQKVDAIVFAPFNTNADYVEFIDECAEKGLPIITCINDIPNSKRAGTVYEDTRIVGDMGAQLLSMIAGGAGNALLVSNKDIQNQMNLIDGFSNRLRLNGNAPLGVFETQNNERIGYYITDMLIKEHPGLRGIFVGMSQSMGVCNRIIEEGLARKVKLVCVDIFKEMAEMLEKDVVQMTIYQQTREIGREAIMLAYDFLTNDHSNEIISLSKPLILIKSNYSDYLY